MLQTGPSESQLQLFAEAAAMTWSEGTRGNQVCEHLLFRSAVASRRQSHNKYLLIDCG